MHANSSIASGRQANITLAGDREPVGKRVSVILQMSTNSGRLQSERGPAGRGLIFARLLPVLLVLSAVFCSHAVRAENFSDEELIDGFTRVVFGLEYPRWGWQRYIVKKYSRPVSFYIDNRSRKNRLPEVRKFIESLDGQVSGLNIGITESRADANFRIYIVDRAQYKRVARTEVYRDPNYAVPGRCLVRVAAIPRGIVRSDAIIVSDEGEFLFKRCLVEEVLQGLGPLNDDPTLDHSVFNDTSRHSTFTRFDVYMLNMLYNNRIKPGMGVGDVRQILPAVVRDVRARLG